MQYFISERDVKTGPFSLEEMKEQHLAKDTLVWYQGLLEWTKASEILELTDLFRSNPQGKDMRTLLFNSNQIF